MSKYIGHLLYSLPSQLSSLIPPKKYHFGLVFIFTVQNYFFDAEKIEKKPEAEKKERSKSKSKRKSTAEGKILFSFHRIENEKNKGTRKSECSIYSVDI